MHVKTQYFLFSLICLLAAYLGFELYFNSHTLITVDEFWFAHRTYQFKSGLPYLDFAPYKTILGYYLLLPPMLISHGIMPTLLAMKNYLAILNTGVLFAGAIYLNKLFNKPAVLIALIIILTSQIMLFFSTNIRVDLLGYWFGFFSFLCVLDNIKQAKLYLLPLAGFLLGLAFCCSQKAIWYLAATNVAFTAIWLLSRQTLTYLRSTLLFNSAAAVIIIAYFIFWSSLTSWALVYHSIFTEAAAMYQLDLYAPLRKEFWEFLLIYNPLYFALWPLTILSLLVKIDDDTEYQRRFFTVIYALFLLACLIPYKQIFPYYLQVSLPVTFVLYSSFFSWLLNSCNNNLSLRSNPYLIWSFCVIYSAIVVYFVYALQLGKVNLFICLIPLLIGILMQFKLTASDKTNLLSTMLITLLFVGLLYPTINTLYLLRRYDGHYQKANIVMLQTLLQQNDSYIAGIELLYTQSQIIPGLRHLMAPAIAYLYHPTAKLRAVMLPSLYEDPNATQSSVISALTKAPIK